MKAGEKIIQEVPLYWIVVAFGETIKFRAMQNWSTRFNPSF